MGGRKIRKNTNLRTKGGAGVGCCLGSYVHVGSTALHCFLRACSDFHLLPFQYRKVHACMAVNKCPSSASIRASQHDIVSMA